MTNVHDQQDDLDARIVAAVQALPTPRPPEGQLDAILRKRSAGVRAAPLASFARPRVNRWLLAAGIAVVVGGGYTVLFEPFVTLGPKEGECMSRNPLERFAIGAGFVVAAACAQDYPELVLEPPLRTTMFRADSVAPGSWEYVYAIIVDGTHESIVRRETVTLERTTEAWRLVTESTNPHGGGGGLDTTLLSARSMEPLSYAGYWRTPRGESWRRVTTLSWGPDHVQGEWNPNPRVMEPRQISLERRTHIVLWTREQLIPLLQALSLGPNWSGSIAFATGGPSTLSVNLEVTGSSSVIDDRGNAVEAWVISVNLPQDRGTMLVAKDSGLLLRYRNGEENGDEDYGELRIVGWKFDE